MAPRTRCARCTARLPRRAAPITSPRVARPPYAEHVIAGARARGETLRVAPAAIQPIATAAYPTPARRPLNSRLDVSRFEADFGLTLPHWTVGVDRVLDEWCAR
jgi:dTDP-4-dehydrorhamnose reductase